MYAALAQHADCAQVIRVDDCTTNVTALAGELLMLLLGACCGLFSVADTEPLSDAMLLALRAASQLWDFGAPSELASTELALLVGLALAALTTQTATHAAAAVVPSSLQMRQCWRPLTSTLFICAPMLQDALATLPAQRAQVTWQHVSAAISGLAREVQTNRTTPSGTAAECAAQCAAAAMAATATLRVLTAAPHQHTVPLGQQLQLFDRTGDI